MIMNSVHDVKGPYYFQWDYFDGDESCLSSVLDGMVSFWTPRMSHEFYEPSLRVPSWKSIQS